MILLIFFRWQSYKLKQGQNSGQITLSENNKTDNHFPFHMSKCYFTSFITAINQSCIYTQFNKTINQLNAGKQNFTFLYMIRHVLL